MYEWRPTYNVRALCGHTIVAGAKGFKVSLALCEQHAASVPQKALQEAILAQYAQTERPSLLYRLWHWCFGKRRKTTPQDRQAQQSPTLQQPLNPRPEAKRSTAKLKSSSRLDDKYRGEARQTMVVHTGVKDSTWLLTVLLACLQVLQQTASQSLAGKPRHVCKNVYTYHPAAH